MAKDHYIPAAILGLFSRETGNSLRKRRVAVQLRSGPAFMCAAQNIGFENHLYRVDGPSLTVDGAWAGIESQMPNAIASLEAREVISARTWLRVLVPYVASLFIRGREFQARFNQRFVSSMKGSNGEDTGTNRGLSLTVADLLTKSNANGARVIEFDRLLAPVLTANWVVSHVPRGYSTVQNEIGLAGTLDRAEGEFGWLVPLSARTALSIFPRERREVVRWTGHRWVANIGHWDVPNSAMPGFNESIASAAQQFIIGRDLPTVTSLEYAVTRPVEQAHLLEQWPFTSRELLSNAQQWHRIVSRTHRERPPEILHADTDISLKLDWKAIGEDWHPGVIHLGDEPLFRVRGLELRDNSLEVSLKDRHAFALHKRSGPSGTRQGN